MIFGVIILRTFAGGGGGDVILYFHTYVGAGIFWGVQIFEFQFFSGFQKNEYFLGYEDFVDIFFSGGGGVITKLDYI